MVGLHPLDQWTTGMQGNVQIGERFKDVQKWKVAVLVGLFEYAVKIANGLVVVQDEAESDGWLVLAHGKIGAEVRRKRIRLSRLRFKVDGSFRLLETCVYS